MTKTLYYLNKKTRDTANKRVTGKKGTSKNLVFPMWAVQDEPNKLQSDKWYATLYTLTY